MGEGNVCRDNRGEYSPRPHRAQPNSFPSMPLFVPPRAPRAGGPPAPYLRSRRIHPMKSRYHRPLRFSDRRCVR
jgi:hypothetical protein